MGKQVVDKHQLWAAWLLGAASYHHPAKVRGPVHPDTRREFEAGRTAAAGGFVQVPNLSEAFEMARHVQAGNPPHTFKGEQIAMPL
ncbi:hypothetical protein D3Y57_07000 [Sphingomonas paeninsulae]|uniref:Uncharacterized protein n=2 Tax=Sphingomonas paeninsulae TaxID=2319844 RepID=A0A494TKX3_SPHPE|nr:hypothetical protein D3Y57_07000 [Sphingomonas paeninsulae]